MSDPIGAASFAQQKKAHGPHDFTIGQLKGSVAEVDDQAEAVGEHGLLYIAVGA
jgi:hypothetical protein